MKKLKPKEIQTAIKSMRKDIFDCKPINRPYKTANVEFPLGEMCTGDPIVEGYILGWKLSGQTFPVKEIEKKDQFNAQGLEGKVVVEKIDFLHACLFWEKLPKYRCNIYV